MVACAEQEKAGRPAAHAIPERPPFTHPLNARHVLRLLLGLELLLAPLCGCPLLNLLPDALLLLLARQPPVLLLKGLRVHAGARAQHALLVDGRDAEALGRRPLLRLRGRAAVGAHAVARRRRGRRRLLLLLLLLLLKHLQLLLQRRNLGRLRRVRLQLLRRKGRLSHDALLLLVLLLLLLKWQRLLLAGRLLPRRQWASRASAGAAPWVVLLLPLLVALRLQGGQRELVRVRRPCATLAPAVLLRLTSSCTLRAACCWCLRCSFSRICCASSSCSCRWRSSFRRRSSSVAPWYGGRRKRRR